MIKHPEIVKQLIDIAKGELKLTMGCTDPIAIALSCNRALNLYITHIKMEKQEVIDSIEKIEILLDKNLLKNASAAQIPGTSGKGIPLAATLGLLLELPENPLLLFKGIAKEHVLQARLMLPKIPIVVGIKDGKNHLFAQSRITFLNKKTSIAIVEGQHDTISFLAYDGIIKYNKQEIEGQSNLPISLQLKDVLSSIEDTPLSNITFINDGFTYNIASGEYKDNVSQNEASILTQLYSEDINSKASYICNARTAISYATSRRMKGEEIPIVSCGGSGNHGITFFISLFYGFNMIAPKKELLHTALFGLYLLHMVKQETGVLTPMCGCALSSALAVAASLTWASGGDELAIIRAMNYVINTLAGIACDGAKPSCSLKTSLAGQVALESTLFALSDAKLSLDEGLSGSTFPLLLSIIKKIHIEGMNQFDSTMVEIIQQRET